MKQLLSILLLTMITATAYAEKSNKATAKSKAFKPKQQQSAQQVDTTKHGFFQMFCEAGIWK